MTRTAAVLAAILGVAIAGLAADAAQRVMRGASGSTATSSSPVTYQRPIANTASGRDTNFRKWAELSDTPAQHTWCVDEDAVYVSCADDPGEKQSELMH